MQYMVETKNLRKVYRTGDEKVVALDNIDLTIEQGQVCCILGTSGSGKSTLLNALLNEERAIVSDIHGTTRDVIEDTVNLGGITFRFIDTAGIRETSDTIESLGIERTFQKLEQAEIVLWIVDATNAVSRIPQLTAQILPRCEGKRLILVFNKADQADEATRERLAALQPDAFIVSAYTGEGLDELRTAVESLLPVPHVHVNALLPYAAGSLISRVREYGKVDKVEYRDDGIQLEADVDAHLAAQVVEQSID